MKYLVVGDVAILATRGIERITGDIITVKTQGIPAGATIYVQSKDFAKGYVTDIGKTARIPVAELIGKGRYAVTVVWEEKDPTTKEKTRREATANAFQISEDMNGMFILPAQGHTEAEIEHMWHGIVQTMENVIPFIEQYRYGNDVI